MAGETLYIVWVLFGSLIWIVFSLWFLRRAFKGYSPASEINSYSEDKKIKKKESVSKKV